MEKKSSSSSSSSFSLVSSFVVVFACVCILRRAESSASTCPSECASVSNVSFPFGTQAGCGLGEFRLRNCTGARAQWAPPSSDGDSALYHVAAIATNQVTRGTVLLQSESAACRSQRQIREDATPYWYNESGLVLAPYGNVELVLGCDPGATAPLAPRQLVRGFNFSSPRCSQFCSACGIPSSTCFEATDPPQADLAQLALLYKCRSRVSLIRLPSRPRQQPLEVQLLWLISQYYYDCLACKASRGACGQNPLDGSFLCLCEDGGHTNSTTTCTNTNPNDCKGICTSSTQISLGIGALAVAILIASACFSIYYCKHSTKHNATSIAFMHKRRTRWKSEHQNFIKENQLKEFLVELSQSNVKPPLRLFTYHELAQATNGFSSKAMVGDGGFGMVFEGTLQGNGEKVAVKKLHTQNERRLEHFANEIRTLSRVDHPNLVKLYGFCASANGYDIDDDRSFSIVDSVNKNHARHISSPRHGHLLLVYEFVSNGTLAHNLHGVAGKGLLWETRLCIAIETAHAIAYLHSQEPPILHRDVKSDNILLDENFHAKLGDFGLSRQLPDNMHNNKMKATHVSTTPQGTPGYVDPEYHTCYQLTEKSDVYSFGVVLVELISGKVPVDISREQGQVNLSGLAVFKIQTGTLDELVDPYLEVCHFPSIKDMVWKVAELAFLCLALARDDRPNMQCVARTLLHIKHSTYHSCSSNPSPLCQ